MTTQLEHARKGFLTKEMQAVAEAEGVTEAFVLDHTARGEIVIPCNSGRRRQKIVGIGTGLRTKVNASIGTASSARIGDIAKYPERRENEKQAWRYLKLILQTRGVPYEITGSDYFIHQTDTE